MIEASSQPPNRLPFSNSSKYAFWSKPVAHCSESESGGPSSGKQAFSEIFPTPSGLLCSHLKTPASFLLWGLDSVAAWSSQRRLPWRSTLASPHKEALDCIVWGLLFLHWVGKAQPIWEEQHAYSQAKGISKLSHGQRLVLNFRQLCLHPPSLLVEPKSSCSFQKLLLFQKLLWFQKLLRHQGSHRIPILIQHCCCYCCCCWCFWLLF